MGGLMDLDKAKEMAIQAHLGQKYGLHPYEKHLQDVQDVLERFELLPEVYTDLFIAAWLHDAVEDTSITIEQVIGEFGQMVGNIVNAVTNEPGFNRADRFNKTANKIIKNPWFIVLKLADKIANTEESSVNDNPSLYKMYIKEYPIFREKLYTMSTDNSVPFSTIEAMWNHLDNISKGC